MNRLFPAPWLSLALWVLWLTLNLSVSPGNLLLGAALGFAAPLMMRKLRPKRARIRNPMAVLRLFLLVGRDVIMSNLIVAWGVLNAGRRPPNSCFIKVPLDLRDAHGLAALARSAPWCPAPYGRSWRWTAAFCCCTSGTCTTRRSLSSTSKAPTSDR